MKNLVPKSVSKNRKYIYKKLSWIDILVVLIYLIISFSLPIGFIIIDITSRLFISLFIFIILMLSMVFLKEQNCRIYEYIYRFFRYKLNIKQYDKNTLKNSYQLVPYQSIGKNNLLTIEYKSNKLFKTDKKTLYAKIFKITGIDLSILSSSERDFTINQFRKFLLSINTSFYLYKIDESVSIDLKIKLINDQMAFLFNQYSDNNIDEIDYEQKINLLNLYKDQLTKMNSDLIKEKNIYIILYSNEVDELYQSVDTLEVCFKDANLIFEELNEKEVINFYTKSFNPYQNSESFEFQDESKKLSEKLEFSKVEFKKDHFIVNNKLFGSFFSVKDYPIVLNDFWIAELFFNNDANISINFSNCDYKKSKKIINSELFRASSNLKYLKDFSSNENFEDLKKLSENFLLKKEILKSVNITFYTYSNNYLNLMEKNLELENILFNNSIRIHKMHFLQIEGFLTYSSFGFNELIKKFSYDIPANTIANGFPFVLNHLNDNNGLKLGTDSFKQELWLDIFSKDRNRKNNNVIIYGQKGSGKTTLISKFVLWNYAFSKNIFIIDTNNKYKNLCSYFKGNYIDIDDYNKSINPLQIFNVSNENNADNSTLINNHLLMLESFFKLILKNLNNNQIEILICIINNIYNVLNLQSKNLNLLSSSDFPVISDVYDFIIKNKNELAQKYELNNIQKIINSLENNFSKGARYYNFFNQHTNLSFNRDFVVFNLTPMISNEPNKLIIQAQIYLILNLLQLKLVNLSNNIVVIDELNSIIENSDSLITNYLCNFAKIISKNNGSLIVSTKNWDDKNSDNFSSLFNESQYAFYFNQNCQTIKLLNNLYDHSNFKISQSEESFLLLARTGQCLLFLSNSKRYQLAVDLCKFEENIFNFCPKEGE